MKMFKASAADRALLYRYLRKQGYSAMEALGWSCGPPDFPVVTELRWLGLMI